jgi:hypothetical protein
MTLLKVMMCNILTWTENKPRWEPFWAILNTSGKIANQRLCYNWDKIRSDSYHNGWQKFQNRMLDSLVRGDQNKLLNTDFSAKVSWYELQVMCICPEIQTCSLLSLPGTKKQVKQRGKFYLRYFCFWCDSPQWTRASSFTRFLEHTHTTTHHSR